MSQIANTCMAAPICKAGDWVNAQDETYFTCQLKTSICFLLAMEDAHTTLLKLGDTNASFFGVYDGHGGRNDQSY